MFRRAQLYYHTLKHLHAVQITNRLQRRLRRPRVSTALGPSLAPALHIASLPKARTMLERGSFRFLNHTAAFSGWNSPLQDPLWRFNLHYFDDLNAEDAVARIAWHQDLIAKWITENPIGEGYGWEAYTISLRAVNWIKWHWRTQALSHEGRHSLLIQARYLAESLETHLGGNHLWANAKALIFLGGCFAGPEAEGWLRLGVTTLQAEIERQILADGGHYERSTMYHGLLCEDLLELISLAQLHPGLNNHVLEWTPVAEKMLAWYLAMSHDDGGIGFFNDAAFGIAPPPEKLVWLASRCGARVIRPRDGLTYLCETGYVRMQRGKGLVLADVGALGPDELLGHAHADSLSFEFSLAGHRVLVNSGTSTYWDQSLRDLQRGTAAHNTVCIDGQNSSEVWSRFRVARRAYTRVLECSEKNGEILVSAEHDGYRRLSGKPLHRRRWTFTNEKFLIEDEITGGFARAEAFYHLHPSVALELSTPFKGKLGVLDVESSAPLHMKPSLFYPEFGLSVVNSTVSAEIVGGRQSFCLTGAMTKV